MRGHLSTSPESFAVASQNKTTAIGWKNSRRRQPRLACTLGRRPSKGPTSRTSASTPRQASHRVDGVKPGAIFVMAIYGPNVLAANDPDRDRGALVDDLFTRFASRIAAAPRRNDYDLASRRSAQDW
jgi:hypothetical protein